MTYKEFGREVMIRFTCCRCGMQEFARYEDVMVGEHYDYLRNSALPEGWGEIDYSRIACPTCIDDFKRFMDGGRVVGA